MKIIESALKTIIDEEIETMIKSGELDEGFLDRLKARGAGALHKLGGSLGSGERSLAAKISGAKAAAATALGADATDLKNKQRDQQRAAVAAKLSGDQRGQAAKIKSILSSHFERLNTDIVKLGLGEDQKVSYLMQALQDAIEAAAEGAAGGE